MKQLLKKEFKISSSPLTYFFILFSLMAFIPSYPILVSGFFVCLGIFYSFQTTREFNDITFSLLLPVKKSDIVKSKYYFVIIIQSTFFLLSLIFVIIRCLFLSKLPAYVDNQLMNANLIYLGYILLIFLAFNIFFLGGFFKTAYYYGKPFISFTLIAFLLCGIFETIHHINGLRQLNNPGFENFIIQFIIFMGALIIYIFGTVMSLKKSIKTFSNVDL